MQKNCLTKMYIITVFMKKKLYKNLYHKTIQLSYTKNIKTKLRKKTTQQIIIKLLS